MLKELIGSKSYKKAFECKKCPQSNSEDGCPNWIEVHQVNNISKEERMLAGCGYQMVPYMLNEINVQIPRSAAEISAMREDISTKIGTAAALYLKVAQRHQALEYVDGKYEELSSPN